jgi:CheY-like chemotaxis protein
MPSILIVDDEEDIRFIYNRVLSKKYTVYEADTGGRAIELYEAHMPDLVMMDTKLPDISGIEATRRIVATWPDAKIIGATGYSDMDAQFLGAGALEVIQKPFSLDELMEIVSKILD